MYDVTLDIATYRVTATDVADALTCAIVKMRAEGLLFNTGTLTYVEIKQVINRVKD